MVRNYDMRQKDRREMIEIQTRPALRQSEMEIRWYSIQR